MMPTYKDTVCSKCDTLHEKCDTQVICDKCIENYEEQVKAFRELMEILQKYGSTFLETEVPAYINFKVYAIIKKYL